jgi:hypothetical protein
MTLRLLLAGALSASVVLSAPFMGQFRAALRSAFPDSFVMIVGAAVALIIVGAVAAALFRVGRSGSPARYMAIAAAVLLGVTYSLVSATGTPEVDVVERVHFVEYGVITLLFYWAWTPRGDASVLALPVLAGLLVGTVEEWFQWFIPVRVGEARDVLLNLVAIACGMLVGVAIDPPALLTRPFRNTPRGSRQQIAYGAGIVIVVFAAFVSTVHVGYLVEDTEAGLFRSRYTRDGLLAHAADRADRWAADPPLTFRRLSREDQYLDEGLWHVRRRNDASAAGDYTRAWHENLILERYFAPVLDTGTYAGPEGHRWSEGQRADARARAGLSPSRYLSDAEPYPIVVIPRAVLWGAVVLVVSALSLSVPRRAVSRSMSNDT